MPKRIHKSGRWPEHAPSESHRFEHWYVDNQVYFLTARCRGQFPALASEQAKSIFWDRFEHYTRSLGFEPWITSLLDNHYHSLGYLPEGLSLKTMMQRLHGSVAKLVNDLLEQQGLDRRAQFWRDQHGHEYFDGCIRDETQFQRAYRYTLTQSTRHNICHDWRDYPHTRFTLSLDEALARAQERRAFMPNVPYKRYEKRP